MSFCPSRAWDSPKNDPVVLGRSSVPTLTPCELLDLPDPPRVAFAIFAATGAEMTVAFDSLTDQGGFKAGQIPQGRAQA